MTVSIQKKNPNKIKNLTHDTAVCIKCLPKTGGDDQEQ